MTNKDNFFKVMSKEALCEEIKKYNQTSRVKYGVRDNIIYVRDISTQFEENFISKSNSEHIVGIIIGNTIYTTYITYFILRKLIDNPLNTYLIKDARGSVFEKMFYQ